MKVDKTKPIDLLSLYRKSYKNNCIVREVDFT